MRDRARAALALPVDQQREALLPMYRAGYAAYGHDWETNTSVMADDYAFVARGTSFLPGMPPSLHGREGYLEGQRQLREVVDVERVEIDALLPLGGRRLVVLSRFVFRAGGNVAEQQVLELHEYNETGELARQSYWFDRAEGLRELGLD